MARTLAYSSSTSSRVYLCLATADIRARELAARHTQKFDVFRWMNSAARFKFLRAVLVPLINRAAAAGHYFHG